MIWISGTCSGDASEERDLARTSIAPEAHVGSSSDVTIDIDIDIDIDHHH